MKENIFGKNYLKIFTMAIALVTIIGCGNSSSEPKEKTLSELIVSTTQYTINTQGAKSDKTFDKDGTFISDITLANGRTFQATGNYVINNNVVTLSRESGTTIVATYLSYDETTQEITLSASLNGKEAFETFWFTSSDSRDTKAIDLSK